MRVGESTRAANRERRHVDLVERLRHILEAQGITVVDTRGENDEDELLEVETGPARARTQRQRNKRRVSFDDAKTEETWLSEHSESIIPLSPLSRHDSPRQSPRNRSKLASQRRAHSASSQRSPASRMADSKHVEHGSFAQGLGHNDTTTPMALFEPSEMQLEINAEAFLATSTWNLTRRVLHVWHDSAIRTLENHAQAYQIATVHDHRTLLRQALSGWQAKVETAREQKSRQRYLHSLEERAKRARNIFLLTKVFTHWATSSRDERIRTSVAMHHVLKVTYFKRWKAVASENQIKVRRVLLLKVFAVWQRTTSRRLLLQKDATAHYEDTLLRKCKTTWFWQLLSRRVEGRHDQRTQRRSLGRLMMVCQSHRVQLQQAEALHNSTIARSSLQALCMCLDQRDQDRISAQKLRGRVTMQRTVYSLQTQVKLAPIAKTLTLKLSLDLQRKALRVWRLHLSLSRQASQVDRKRVLQTAWTNWNDELRCRALGQSINERVLVENLYRWVLRERAELLRRAVDSKLLNRALKWWLARAQQSRDRLQELEAVFAERQRRRRMASGIFTLHVAMRKHEDKARAALEFANSRALPRVLVTLREKTDHLARLAKWSRDARFYGLCSGSVKLWHKQTGEHKQHRRREAYRQIRAKIKIRVVGQCLMQWRTKAIEIHSINGEADRRAHTRVATVGTRAFNQWHARTVQLVDLNARATGIDHQKLLDSALSAASAKRSELAKMDQRANDFRHETDLVLLASALRRAQWATFTSTRRSDSADALRARNRDLHLKHMLKHWANRTASRRLAAQAETTAQDHGEPESPSLRPASRSWSRTNDRNPSSSPPLLTAIPSTPAYLRSPARSRRAGRFRPLLTPAPVTPMAFDTAYLATVPAPLNHPEQAAEVADTLVPQVTPFERKLRAGGFATLPPSALKSSTFGRSGRDEQSATKSVRFVASRFRNRGDAGHWKES